MTTHPFRLPPDWQGQSLIVADGGPIVPLGPIITSDGALWIELQNPTFGALLRVSFR
jgi:hypothetical protein